MTEKIELFYYDFGTFRLDGGAMFGSVPKTIWSNKIPADEKNRIPLATKCLILKTSSRCILIDTGNGSKWDEKYKDIYAIEYKPLPNPEIITDVILTHLHFDHCGGSIIRQGDQLVPAFPNAVYWSNTEHWDWAVYPNDREKASFLKENILPIKESGQLQMVEINGGIDGKLGETVFTDNISIRFVSGHTQAMMLPQINYNGRTVVFMADLLPSAGHIPIPYVMAYDMFPLTTLHEKKSFLQEAATNDYLLFFEHDPVHECCSLQQTEKGIRAGNYFRLEEL